MKKNLSMAISHFLTYLGKVAHWIFNAEFSFQHFAAFKTFEELMATMEFILFLHVFVVHVNYSLYKEIKTS